MYQAIPKKPFASLYSEYGTGNGEISICVNYSIVWLYKMRLMYKKKEELPEIMDFMEKLRSVVSMITDYFSDLTPKGVNMLNPDTLYNRARALMRGDDGETSRFRDIVKLYMETGLFVHSTGSIGRQYTGNIPLTAIMDMVNSIVNQPSSFYEASQLPCVAEKIMAEELNRFIGFDKETFTMVHTSGGSLANLTAILSARNNRYGECMEKGVRCGADGLRPAVAIGRDAHYSIVRAVEMLGIGRDNIVWLPLDGKRRIDMSAVPSVLDDAKRSGMDVFCTVCSAGSTSFGAVDPIEGLAQISRDRGMWLHVDGCHGASLAVSDRLRDKLRGLEMADSLSWDAHKMLFVPSPCSLLFYRDRRKAAVTFHGSADYVSTSAGSEYGSGEINFECTKRPTIMNLWTAWAIYGREFFASRIERLCDLCGEAWEMLRKQPDFETLHKPEMNILCFRHVPDCMPEGMSDSDFQAAIRDAVCRKGHFFISRIVIDGTAALRIVIMNHNHNMGIFGDLLDEIRSAGKEILMNMSNK